MSGDDPRETTELNPDLEVSSADEIGNRILRHARSYVLLSSMNGNYENKIMAIDLIDILIHGVRYRNGVRIYPSSWSEWSENPLWRSAISVIDHPL
jgi:hypothetical protein